MKLYLYEELKNNAKVKAREEYKFYFCAYEDEAEIEDLTIEDLEESITENECMFDVYGNIYDV